MAKKNKNDDEAAGEPEVKLTAVTTLLPDPNDIKHNPNLLVETLRKAPAKNHPRARSDGAPTTHRARLSQTRIVDAILTASVDRAKRLVRRSSDARVGAVSRARAAFGRARRAGRGERRRMGR